MITFSKFHSALNQPRALALLLLTSSALLSGCATPVSHEAMVPTSFENVKKHPQSVSVVALGGMETESTGKPKISNPMLAQALTEAITKSQSFSRVVQGNGADYVLTVNIFSIEQPSFGLSFKVKLETGWTLKRADTGATVWQESVVSEHTATTSDAFAAVTRLKIATEGAAKNNISLGIAKLSKLTL